jgi:sigma-B regulation protein RsbU (phosphoserine phosphatase)
MAAIEVRSGKHTGERFDLNKDETIVGRYPFCDIVLSEANVSRQHTRFVGTPDGYFVEDMNSLNGTFVNGQKIAKRTKLNANDRVHIYEILVIFQLSDAPSQNDISDDEKTSQAAALSQEHLVNDDESNIVNALNAAAGPSLEAYTKQKLKAVLELTALLGSTLDIDEVLPKILDGLFQLFPQSDRGYILFGEAAEDLVLRAEKQKKEGTVVSSSLGPISRSMGQRVMSRGEAILSADVFHDEALQIADSVLDFPMRSMMCAPLIGPMRKPLGIIYLDTNNPEERFEEEDLEVLVSVAQVAGQAVEYAQTHRAFVELDRRKRELAMAREVQLHFLPQRRPDLENYEFFNFYQSAEQIGGDYHGYIPLPDGRLAIAVGDVSGKGVSAALLMARLCSDVRYCLATSTTPADAVYRLNVELSDPTRDSCFVTFTLAVLNPTTNVITVVNAGHMPPILRRADGGLEELGFDEGGPPLGCDESLEYGQVECELQVDDVVVMYTDGISEAMNTDNDLFGVSRVRSHIATGPESVHDLGTTLLANVEKFVDNRKQADDMCLVAFSRSR